MKRVLVIAMATTLSGCAVTEATVPIPYTPAATTADPQLANIHVSVAASDARTTNRGRIGTKVNGYGMEMAAIRTNDDIAEDVKNAIATELKDRGYALGSGGVQIDAAVTAFYSQFSVGIFAGRADGRSDMTIKVLSSTGAPLYRRDLHGLSQQTIELASGPNAARAISAALSNAMTTLFADPDFVRALATGQVAGAAPAT